MAAAWHGGLEESCPIPTETHAVGDGLKEERMVLETARVRRKNH